MTTGFRKNLALSQVLFHAILFFGIHQMKHDTDSENMNRNDFKASKDKSACQKRPLKKHTRSDQSLEEQFHEINPIAD